MNSRLIFGAGAMWLVLGSCTVGPKYIRPAASIPAAFKEAVPAGWVDAQPNDGALRGKWWMVYDDAGLNALEDQVSISNQNVLAAEAQFHEAKAAVNISKANQFPSVSAAPSGTRSGTGAAPEGGGFYTIPFELTYPIDVWGNIRRSVASDSAIAQASAADLENARLLYQAELASDYFQIQGLDASRQLLEVTVKSYEQTVQLTQDRFDGGVASMSDVAQAQTQLETARVQLADLGVDRAHFEHAIAVLTGHTPSDVSIPAIENQAPPPATFTGVPSTLLERRPDIAAAERQVAAANERVGIAKTALYPSLTLGASAGLRTTDFLDLLSLPSRFWSVGPQMAESLFDGGKRHAQIRLTQAAYDATVANYRQTVLTAFQQVEDSLSQLRILSDESEIADRAVKAAQQSLEISTIQYRAGTANYLQVITAQTSTLQNQRSVVDLLTRRMVASVSLIQALGGGWDTSQLPSTKDLRSD